jgi:hypothetical protein
VNTSDGVVQFSIADIADTPHYYPLALDSAQERVLLTRLSEADYRVSSFLDNRVVMPGMRTTWVPLASLWAASKHVKARPLHFIFHSGHVGSTLLSRLLDEIPGVLGLREPVPLRTLADDHDQLSGGVTPQFNTRLATFLNLWSRGFRDTRAVIVKSTSIASRLAPTLLGMAAKSRAVYLNVSLQTYLATMLGSTVADEDIAAFGPLRAGRLSAMLQTALPEVKTKGEAIAIAWLAERITQQMTQSAAGERVLVVDFDHMLTDLPQTLARIATHLELKAGPAVIAKLAKSTVLTRYSKSPERHAFSHADRTARLQQALRAHAAEVESGKRFAAALSAQHEIVAAILRAPS